MQKKDPHPGSRGFTLVELSIVLVILGLLVGGVLTGQSLIRAAELRSVSTQISQYTTALNTFKDKYFALPGDMTNATMYWGKDNANCSGHTGTAATPGTCNGNGDGIIGDANFVGSGQFFETYRAWQQLANAGLISGNYTGVSASGNGYTSVAGTNVPGTRIVGSAMGFGGGSGFGTTIFPTYFYPMSSTTIIEFGHMVSGDLPEGQVITQSDAFNIDTKLDDGKPGQGKVQVWRPSASAEPTIGNANCASDNDPTIAVYKLSMNTVECSMLIQMAQ